MIFIGNNLEVGILFSLLNLMIFVQICSNLNRRQLLLFEVTLERIMYGTSIAIENYFRL